MGTQLNDGSANIKDSVSYIKIANMYKRYVDDNYGEFLQIKDFKKDDDYNNLLGLTEMEIARLCKELNVNDKEFEKSVEEFILNRFHSQS